MVGLTIEIAGPTTRTVASPIQGQRHVMPQVRSNHKSRGRPYHKHRQILPQAQAGPTTAAGTRGNGLCYIQPCIRRRQPQPIWYKITLYRSKSPTMHVSQKYQCLSGGGLGLAVPSSLTTGKGMGRHLSDNNHYYRDSQVVKKKT